MTTLITFRDEVQEMRKTRDPITGFRDRIIGAELAETSEIKAIELEVKQSVDADVKKAKVRFTCLIFPTTCLIELTDFSTERR